MSNKNSCDSEVEEPDYLLSPCFRIDPSTELKDVPTTGEEFLLKVMKEREKCVATPTCNRDLSKYAKNQTYFVKEPELLKPAPEALKSTIEWQNVQVADFSEVRMYVSRMQADKSRWPKTVKKIEIDYNNPTLWKKVFQGKSPTLSLVFGIGHRYLDNCLINIIKSMEDIKPGETISEDDGKWIYAILACMSTPLQSDTVSLLRDLARRCSEIRSHINPEDENAVAKVAPLNIFICIVSRYFGQLDLAE